MTDAGIEFRLITGGNFLRHDVIKYYDYEFVGGAVPHAETAHDLGFFVGNHPFDLPLQLTRLQEVLDARLRRVVIAMRNLVFPHVPSSGLLYIRSHLQVSANSYGWRSTSYGLPCRDALEDYHAIAILCEQEDADILLLDEQMPMADFHYGRRARTTMFDQLRQRMPLLELSDYIRMLCKAARHLFARP